MGSKQNQKIILDYLAKENRPLSAQDLVNNLNGQIGKTNAVNILEELAKDKKINEKIYGKQKVYMTLQTVDCTNFKSELRQLDEKIFNLNGDLNRLKAENIKLENELKNYEDNVPLSELESTVNDLCEEIEVLKERLGKIKSSNTELITKEEKAKIQKEYEKYAKEWRKLKRIANDMIGAIVENCNIKKAELCEDLGLVLDEHENVQPPKI